MRIFLVLLAISILVSCKEVDTKPLDFIGNKQMVNGKEVIPTVGNFSHYNQDSVLMTNASLKDYIYVTDFFFTSCPSICPKVMKEMIKIHDEIKNEPMVKMVSFTIDPKRDNVSKLKLYANNLEIDQRKWYFLTGDKDQTLDLANTYFSFAAEDSTAPGGFDHSGKIILVDKEGHVRSYSEGTDPTTTDKLIADILKLRDSYTSTKK